MPRRMTQTKSGTAQVLTNVSFESLVVSWLMRDGWQVFIPMLDNAHRTDILISDGPNYYRLQVKTIDTTGKKEKDIEIENKWDKSYLDKSDPNYFESHLDYIVWFARNTTWGYVTLAFSEKRRKLKTEGHIRFESRQTFLKALHALQ